MFDKDAAPSIIFLFFGGVKKLHMEALKGEFGVNHYGNKLARGPSEGEERKEGLVLGSFCLFEGNECSVPALG